MPNRSYESVVLQDLMKSVAELLKRKRRDPFSRLSNDPLPKGFGLGKDPHN